MPWLIGSAVAWVVGDTIKNTSKAVDNAGNGLLKIAAAAGVGYLAYRMIKK